MMTRRKHRSRLVRSEKVQCILDNKMFLFLLVYAVFPVNAEFSLVPLINEAVIGDSTYFDCTTTTHTNKVNFYHYGVGAKNHEDICIYCLGKIHPKYINRIAVQPYSNTYRLLINPVLWEDAGRYMCQDNGGIGDSLIAELVVLASIPVCHSNMKPDGLLGPNSCNIEPEELKLSCNVSYHGNISPVLQWREIRSSDSTNRGVSCRQTGYDVTCDLAMNANFGLHGSSYVCETTVSATTRYNCSAGIISVIHVNSKNSVTVHGTKEAVICSANSSQSCNYTWKWIDEGHGEVVSKSSALTPSKPGLYRCEAECSIRNIQCTVLSRQILVTEEDTGLSNTAAVIALTCILMITVEIVIVFLVCILKRLRQRDLKSQENNTLIDDSDESGRSISVKQHFSAITTKSAKEKGLLIRGMAIIDDELFVVTQLSSEIEVFNCKSLVLSRRWILKDLIRPADIGSCKTNRCLYIMDWKDDSSRKEVLCVDTNGELLRSWNTDDDYGDMISVSNGNNVIVTCLGKRELNEYSSEGKMIRKISLQWAEFPTHAIKLSNDKFMVSGGDSSHLLHRVCIVDALGKVDKSFGGEKGSDWTQLNHPMQLAVFTDGSVAVIDNGNRRVLLLDKDLQFNRVLLSNNIHGLQNPTRLLLDESNDLLFVADSHNGAAEILVFHLKVNLSM